MVRALELGGDDFLTKPYNHKVLLARIMQTSAVSRWMPQSPASAATTVRPLRWIPTAIAWKDGRSIHLADMEYRILTLFIRHPNTFFTANELYRKIWGKESLGDVRTVQVHIHNLRSKIEPDPAKPIYLKMSGAKAIFSARKGRRRPEMVLLS